MNQLLHKICLFLLVVSLQLAKLEVSFVLAILFTGIFATRRISQKAVLVVFILFLLIVVGSLRIFSPENDYYHLIKDLIYFLRPIFVLTAAYFIVIRLEKRSNFFNILVLSGFFFASIHLFRILIYIFEIRPDVNIIRNSFGRYNHVETIALTLLICVRDIPVKRSRYKILYQFFVAVLIASYIAYFSRTMILVTGCMVLAYYGYLKLNRRGMIALFILFLMGAGLVAFLQQYEIPDEPTTITDTFLQKVKNSYTESFEFDAIIVNDLDRRPLWKHWRAYEAYVVRKELNAGETWLIGESFGSTIDIGFEAPLDGEWTQHLSLTHNGFAYLLMKTGIIGLIIYSLLILYLYTFYYVKKRNEEHRKHNNLLVACSFYILVTTFVVTGIFKPYDMAMLLVGGVFAMKQLESIENRNIRNTGNP